MNGNPQVIQVLQMAMAAEAQLNLQYRLNTRLLKFEGVKLARKKFRKFADDAHEFLRAVSDQLLFLSGDQDGTAGYLPPAVLQPPNVTVLLEQALSLEMSICTQYENGIPLATEVRDDETRNLFEHLIKWHHDHVRWIEKKLRNIRKYTEDEVILAGKL